MIVVSDTSPVRALVQLGLLDGLTLLFQGVLIPPSVAAELRVVVPGLPTIDLGRTSLRVEAPMPSPLLDRLMQELGHGEAEAIALAVERRAEYVLIDDGDGRVEAARAGVRPMGVLGVLVQMKDAGRVDLVAPLIERLEVELTFRVSPIVKRQALELAGEWRPP